MLLSNHQTLYIENEFFFEKEESAFDLFICKIGENINNDYDIKQNQNKSGANQESGKVENSEKKEIENMKNQNQNVEFQRNENKKEKIEKNIEENKEENNVKNNSEKILNKPNKKNKKDDGYTQTFSKNDFKDRPPKVSNLFLHEFDYENKNVFSHLNDSFGSINESKKVPNIFYNHLFINKKNNNNGRYVLTSINKRHYEKELTYLYYAP